MANIARIDPFGDLVDDLFKGFFVRPVSYEGAAGAREGMPRMKVDVVESNGAYVVAAELPGVRKEDIQVTIDGASVTLAAEVKREKEVQSDERVLHTERVFGKLTRSFTLPQELDEERAEAQFRDGVLELKLPKKAAAQRRQIAIN
jgi:HSP20 family protein